MRKFLAFLLVLIMLLPCISGCLNRNQDKTKSYKKLIELERFSSMTIDGTTSIDVVYTHTNGKETAFVIEDEDTIEKIMTEIFDMGLEEYPEDQDIDFYYRSITVHQGDTNYLIVLGSISDENGNRYLLKSYNLCNIIEKYIAEFGSN